MLGISCPPIFIVDEIDRGFTVGDEVIFNAMMKFRYQDKKVHPFYEIFQLFIDT